MTLVHKLLDKITTIRSTLNINPYLLSFFSVLIAFMFQWIWGQYLVDNSILIIFIIAVLVSAWYGGFGPGITATLMSGFIAGYLLFQTNSQQLRNIVSFIFELLIFLIGGFLISIIIEARNKNEKEREKILLNEKLARRSAEQQARIRDHFISVASHELKSPITSQKAYLQILKKHAVENKHMVYENYLNKIETQIDKLTDFINDMLDVSKMNSRKLQYNLDDFDMMECVREAIEHIGNLLVTHKVHLNGHVKRKVHGDKNRIYQVITNLLSNAIKYSPNADQIVVTLEENKKAVIVSVKDYGIGINPAHQEKIFNRFFRVSGHDESNFKGVGLGLYLSSQIIKKHKGKIWVESVEKEGSTFYFSIPINK